MNKGGTVGSLRSSSTNHLPNPLPKDAILMGPSTEIMPIFEGFKVTRDADYRSDGLPRCFGLHVDRLFVRTLWLLMCPLLNQSAVGIQRFWL